LQASQLHATAFVRLASSLLQFDPSNRLFSGRADNDLRVVLRALLAVPCCVGPSSSAVALQGLQLLFAPKLATIVLSAGAQLAQNLPEAHAALAAAADATVDTSTAADKTVDSSTAAQLLFAGYGAAWLGREIAALAGPLPTGCGVSIEQTTHWQDPWDAVGRRLPAAPDWFVLALASPGATAPDRKGAGASDGATRDVQTLAAATTWLLGLYQMGVLPCHNGSNPRLQGKQPDTANSEPGGQPHLTPAFGNKLLDVDVSSTRGAAGAVCMTVKSADVFFNDPALSPDEVRFLHVDSLSKLANAQLSVFARRLHRTLSL
jgi:hypothetical protein